MTLPEEPLFPFVAGTLPGVIDTSQRDRLLKSPSTVLCFATYDALTANSGWTGGDQTTSTHRPSSLDSKRIVIETNVNTGVCTWRFVPRARSDPGLVDEGTWPRLVQLCGRVVRMTEDQWDIHKLDPEYECIVRTPPAITSINRRLPAADLDQDIPPLSAHNTVPETPEKTVKMEGTTPTPKFRGQAQGAPNPDDDPVFLGTRMPGQSFRSPNHMSVDGDASSSSFFNQSTPKDPGNKRPRTWQKEKSPAPAQERIYIDLQSTSEDSDADMERTKRTRFQDPFTARRELHQKKVGRERKRKAELDARLRARRDILQNAFWDELGVPPELRDSTVFSDPTDPSSEPRDPLSDPADPINDPTDPEPEGEEKPIPSTSKSTSEEPSEDEEAIRQTKIEESRRKLAELEKDKPFWEEEARRRKEQELRAEEEKKQQKIRREEEERKRAAYRRYVEQYQLERQSHEQEMRKQRKGTQMVVTSHVKGGLRWSARSALERYTQTAIQFDSAQYNASNPLLFQSIPWPMLSPTFTINDIQWTAVEKFFKTVEGYLPRKDFQELVEKSHKRFHPDRWRSRRILTSVQDDLERDLLEVAGSTVAQALTPLWKKVTGRE